MTTVTRAAARVRSTSARAPSAHLHPISRGDPPLQHAEDTHDRYDLILPSGRRGKGRRRFDDDDPAPRAPASGPERPRAGGRRPRRPRRTGRGPSERRVRTRPGCRPSTVPTPRPDWVVTELAAVDTELGVLKTGKEADVHLLERAVPARPRASAGREALPRPPSTGCSTATPATSRAAGCGAPARCGRWRPRTAFGRDLIAGQWARGRVRRARRGSGQRRASPVPYPVQLRRAPSCCWSSSATDDGTAAPRLAQVRPDPDELADLWRQLVDALTALAAAGLAHGDLSAVQPAGARRAGWS